MNYPDFVAHCVGAIDACYSAVFEAVGHTELHIIISCRLYGIVIHCFI